MTTIQRYALAALTCFALILGSVDNAQATNLKFGRVLSPAERVLLFQPGISIPISIMLRNDSTFDAEAIFVYLYFSYAGSIFFRDTATVNFLPTRDSVAVTFESKLMPTVPGKYEVGLEIDYAFDVIPGDNFFSFPVTFLEGPQGLTFGQYDMFRPPYIPNSAEGEVTYDPGSAVTDLRIINIYGYPDGMNESVWLIRNWPILPFPTNDPTSIRIDWSKLGYSNGEDIDSVDLSITIEDTFTINKPTEMLKLSYKVLDLAYDLGGLTYPDADEPDSTKLGTYIEPTFEFFNPPGITDTVIRGCTVPNLDLDSSANNPGTVPGYAGDKNACVPTATANSMQWLESQHPEIQSGLTHRQKLRELSQAMNRAPETGVTDIDFIRGKLAYIDKYKLPIKVKFQSEWIRQDSTVVHSPDPRYGHTADNQSVDLPGEAASGPTVSRAFLRKEMHDSEDVEVNVGWYDSTGHWRYGHSVVVTGVYELNGKTNFIVKHDRLQMVPGGLIQETITFDSSEGVTTRAPEWDYLDPNFGWLKGYVTTIVSESYDPSVTYPSDGVGEDLHKIELRLTGVGADRALEFDLSSADQVELTVTDLLGRRVGALSPSYREQGRQRIALRSVIETLPAGTYFIRVEGENVRGTVKLQR